MTSSRGQVSPSPSTLQVFQIALKNPCQLSKFLNEKFKG